MYIWFWNDLYMQNVWYNICCDDWAKCQLVGVTLAIFFTFFRKNFDLIHNDTDRYYGMNLEKKNMMIRCCNLNEKYLDEPMRIYACHGKEPNPASSPPTIRLCAVCFASDIPQPKSAHAISCNKNSIARQNKEKNPQLDYIQ